MATTWDYAEPEPFAMTAAQLHAQANRLLCQDVVDFDAYDRLYRLAEEQAARENAEDVAEARCAVEMASLLAGWLSVCVLLLYAATSRFGFLVTAVVVGLFAVMFYGSLVATAVDDPETEEE